MRNGVGGIKLGRNQDITEKQNDFRKQIHFSATQNYFDLTQLIIKVYEILIFFTKKFSFEYIFTTHYKTYFRISAISFDALFFMKNLEGLRFTHSSYTLFYKIRITLIRIFQAQNHQNFKNITRILLTLRPHISVSIFSSCLFCCNAYNRESHD